jgi:hypothetical protein
MPEMSEEEQQRILHSLPKGTFALMLVYGLIMAVGWLALYFGRFLAHGPVS